MSRDQKPNRKEYVEVKDQEIGVVMQPASINGGGRHAMTTYVM
jgi:hypothetical protein